MGPVSSSTDYSPPPLEISDVRRLLSSSQRIFDTGSDDEIEQFIHQALAMLSYYLIDTNCGSTECQLICGTGFFSILAHHPNPEEHLERVVSLIADYHESRLANVTVDKKETATVMGLIYGIFQSCFTSFNRDDITRRILERSFQVLTITAYDYSEFTFVTFKILQGLGKLLKTIFKDILLDDTNSLHLLQITIHNWENPITGVRDLNKNLFGLYLDIATKDNGSFQPEQLIEEINSFAWNKAKYLMLSEVISRESKSASVMMQNNPDWINGLLKSLKTSSLVSAGADMYFSILKKTKSDQEWCYIFLSYVKKILDGSDFAIIQNFNNYWCMNTFKQFPDVFNVLAEHRCKIEDEISMYAHLSVLRQGNRQGLVTKCWEKSDPTTARDDTTFINVIEHGLESSNVNVRIMAFEILCISHNNTLPTKVEFDLVGKFLFQNVNCDSATLRMSLLNNMRQFCNRLLISAMNASKLPIQDHLEDLVHFCNQFQRFFKDQLTLRGNYQRKITTVKLCEIVLSTFGQPQQRKRRRALETQNTFTIKQWLMDRGEWHMNSDDFIELLMTNLEDPSDDVRETVSKILLDNYFRVTRMPEKLRSIIDKSLKNLKSKFFYETNSGLCGINILTHILTDGPSENLQFNTIEELFQHFVTDLITEIDNKTDILTSIETGKPLHSMMKVLQNILEISMSEAYPIERVMPPDVTETLVMKLKQVPLFYVTEESKTCSPDFAEMSEMVERLISQSSLKSEQNTEIQLSDLHQIVLNCVWLNLKACCDLLAVLVECTERACKLDLCYDSLNTIANVLETSRHKGAIEGAGVALGRSVKYLTSSESSKFKDVPMTLLKNKLDELMLTNEQRSITRRGAGLSIMLHRIVSNDADKEKPLFHYAINRLLDGCSFKNDEVIVKKENEIDIPQAINIHLMTKIVADSSLASDSMFYSARLADVAFGHLTSDQWQIRNAALQLYGALVPKLIGQKKSSGDNEDTSATVAFDELRTHSVKLWLYILQKIDRENVSNDILSHSNLVPILNLLASTAKKYNFSFDSVKYQEANEKMFFDLMELLNSPVYTVRRLAAKSIELMYDFDKIIDYMSKVQNVPENSLHGILLLVENYKIRMGKNVTMRSIEQILRELIKNRRSSFVVKAVFEKIFWNEENCVHKIKSTLDVLAQNKNIAGASVWANTIIQNCIVHCNDTDLPEIVKCVLDNEDFEMFCDDVILRITHKNVTRDVLTELASVLLEYRYKFSKCGIWKILYEITIQTNVAIVSSVVSEIVEYFTVNNWNLPYKTRFLAPFTANSIKDFLHDGDFVNMFSKYLYSLTDYEIVDIEMRNIAAISVNSLAESSDICSFSYKGREYVILSVLNMLQDDDEDVRYECAKFYSKSLKIHFIYQPFTCLQRIINYSYLFYIFGEELTCFVNKLNELVMIENKISEKGYNPFVLDARNIYSEPKQFAVFVEALMNEYQKKDVNEK